MNRTEVEAGYKAIQEDFASRLEGIDGSSRFERRQWSRPGGGGGDSWTLAGDGPIERAAVNVSAVWGDMPSGPAERLAVAGSEFFATGVSIIVHPANPHAPTFHANLRYFETTKSAWFGGGCDLTPYYLYEEDAAHFHGVLREVCDRHAVADYPAWKAACDEYFYLPHRGEARGIGGIFFDHLTSLEKMWDFQRDLGERLATAYFPILESRVDAVFGEPQKRWHEVRRGRYVEFNLVWDRGTRFGLDTGGRTESILASLPPRARWDESLALDPGSPEAALLALVTGPPREWV